MSARALLLRFLLLLLLSSYQSFVLFLLLLLLLLLPHLTTHTFSLTFFSRLPLLSVYTFNISVCRLSKGLSCALLIFSPVPVRFVLFLFMSLHTASSCSSLLSSSRQNEKQKNLNHFPFSPILLLLFLLDSTLSLPSPTLHPSSSVCFLLRLTIPLLLPRVKTMRDIAQALTHTSPPLPPLPSDLLVVA